MLVGKLNFEAIFKAAVLLLYIPVFGLKSNIESTLAVLILYALIIFSPILLCSGANKNLLFLSRFITYCTEALHRLQTPSNTIKLLPSGMCIIFIAPVLESTCF